MVQGKTKGLSQKASGSNSGRHAAKAAANMKKGKRQIAPKKAQLVKQAAMHKQLSAKINKSVEQQMVNAASSGKLTIMKNVGDEAAQASKKEATVARKGKDKA
ncbi:hypothetical protein PUNSTDRAFT_42007 [Punctularia strigosozonata HHB-11173 SS5]|uniref:uncharacterized protein n=1 Tax=Punctularia strigosozonata (strain HHB-11173) TaxID=741275 RepID=UPI00044184BC|nr:uncharacterized protein PUNSTDRAFT_42007 [Punctularia strigosozonata HHB-11173 SS5]EIN12371.1 hypothetical protein PUNSTDRAFT_42007 [Punctularia strigosozonata HHB-11173 SS5]